MRIKRTDTAQGRWYNVLHEGETHRLPSVTTIGAVVGKPALLRWASKKSVQAVLASASAVREDSATLSSDEYLKAVTTHLQAEIAKCGACTQGGDQKRHSYFHERDSHEKSHLGNRVHKRIDYELATRPAPDGLGQDRGAPPPLSVEEDHCYQKWVAWSRTVDIHPIKVEEQIYSITHGFAGTLDLLAMIDLRDGNGPQLSVVDWKTGGIYEDAFLQSVAYQVAAEERGFGTAVRGLIIQVPREDVDMEIVEVPPVADLFPVFCSVKTVFDWKQTQPRKKPKKKTPVPFTESLGDA